MRRIVECYWIVRDDNPDPTKQQIIPDGFPEIIFHLGDPYRINITGSWRRQAKNLIAGQIRSHFFLGNTGVSHIIGIKLQPCAPALLFGLDMHHLTDKVLNLQPTVNGAMRDVEDLVRLANTSEEKITALDRYFRQRLNDLPPAELPVEKAVRIVFERKGMVTVNELSQECSLGPRALERAFNRYVGLSPKFYARIIRFGFIFQLIKDRTPDWADVVYRAGYYDQSHFIRNFKAFTGEDPTAYLFEEQNLANFFLKK